MASILIIDDELQIRVMMRRILEKVGYEVYEASDGKEGIKLFREKPTDLVITDIIMPEKEGLETILDLRHDFPKIKIIAISGGGKTGLPNFLPAAKKFGAIRTLPKPFGKDDLLKMVKEVLDTK
jgi:YesN/AraC family two-component response regulator